MSSPPPPLVKVGEIPGRGRALIAARPIRAGEIILSDTPLLLYPSDTTATAFSSFCSGCFRTLPSSPLRCSSCPTSAAALFCSPRCSAAHSPLACHTLPRLRHLPPDLLSQAHFLLAAYSLPHPAFSRLLSLQGGAAATDSSAATLHALIAPPPDVTPDFTAALLAKDKMNAFGLMEPFCEADAGNRTVRAYGIYLDASFFNHDCLPNACRFDYVDAGGDRNTEMVFRAIHDIPQGREVCISYFPVNWSYKERQQRLLEDYGFHCVCDRCEVEKNWKDDDGEEVDEGTENMDQEDEDGDGVDEEEYEEEEMQDNSAAGDFPHAYFFVRYVCERENCGGTLAPLPPSPQGLPSGVMECSVCGLLRKDGDVEGDGDDDSGDGVMLH